MQTYLKKKKDTDERNLFYSTTQLAVYSTSNHNCNSDFKHYIKQCFKPYIKRLIALWSLDENKVLPLLLFPSACWFFFFFFPGCDMLQSYHNVRTFAKIKNKKWAFFFNVKVGTLQYVTTISQCRHFYIEKKGLCTIRSPFWNFFLRQALFEKGAH